MKKILTSLLAALLCTVGFSMGAYADTDPADMVPVVVSVPQDWEVPCLWAWADDGTNAFEAWPGEEMETLEEGWYYGYVPSFVQNVIVNANEGTVQTEAVVVEAGSPVWITVGEDLTAEVSYEALTGSQIPEYVEKFTVHAYVPLSWETANLWAWSAPDGTNAFEAWPGQALTEGEDGWFTGKAPVWINSIIVNGNEGSVQTEDISVEPKELWVTVYEDLTYELAYEDPEKAVEDITVHAKVPADWEAPGCWAWSAPDGTNAFASWPGEAFAQNGDWYEIQVPGWINSVIVNANEGGVQTSDLSVDPGKELWIVVADAENAQVFYEEPQEDAQAAPAGESGQDDEDASLEAGTDAAAQDAAADTAAEEAGTQPAQTEAVAEGAGAKTNVGAVVGVVAVLAVAGGAAAAVAVKKKKKQ